MPDAGCRAGHCFFEVQTQGAVFYYSFANLHILIGSGSGAYATGGSRQTATFTFAFIRLFSVGKNSDERSHIGKLPSRHKAQHSGTQGAAQSNAPQPKLWGV